MQKGKREKPRRGEIVRNLELKKNFYEGTRRINTPLRKGTVLKVNIKTHRMFLKNNLYTLIIRIILCVIFPKGIN